MNKILRVLDPVEAAEMFNQKNGTNYVAKDMVLVVVRLTVGILAREVRNVLCMPCWQPKDDTEDLLQIDGVFETKEHFAALCGDLRSMHIDTVAGTGNVFLMPAYAGNPEEIFVVTRRVPQQPGQTRDLFLITTLNQNPLDKSQWTQICGVALKNKAA